MSQAIQNVLKSFPVVLEMLEYRGTDTTPFKDITETELQEKLSSGGNSLLVLPETPHEFKIVYNIMSKFDSNKIRTKLQESNGETDIKQVLYISQEMPNSLIQRKIREIGNNVQIYHIKDLLFNITKHQLVPRHEAIKEPKEIEELVRTYHLKSKMQFPHIQQDDAMARFLDLKPGELVKIHRVSPSSGVSYYYRTCVPA